jgi:hypothetical protein
VQAYITGHANQTTAAEISAQLIQICDHLYSILPKWKSAIKFMTDNALALQSVESVYERLVMGKTWTKILTKYVCFSQLLFLCLQINQRSKRNGRARDTFVRSAGIRSYSIFVSCT